MLYDKIVADMKEAMKNKDKDSLSTIRLLKSAIDLESKNKGEEITDELITLVVARQIKTHNSSIEEFKSASRDDLVSNLEREIKLLETYLPEQLSEEEILVKIEKAFEKVNPTSKQDMGKIMKELNSIKGKADFKFISTKVNEKLSNL